MDTALLRSIETGNAVEQRCLASAVRPDHGSDGAFRHFKVHIAQRGDSAKVQVSIDDFENVHFSSNVRNLSGARNEPPSVSCYGHQRRIPMFRLVDTYAL